MNDVEYEYGFCNQDVNKTSFQRSIVMLHSLLFSIPYIHPKLSCLHVLFNHKNFCSGYG